MTLPSKLWTAVWLWDHCVPEPNTGCWLWCGDSWAEGYGKVTVRRQHKRKVYGAHRVSFAIAQRKMPSNQILHSCDTPACVNPSHLREGSQKDNVADAIKRGHFRLPFQGKHV